MIVKEVPRNEDEYDLMLQNMAAKMRIYEAALNVTQAQTDALTADAAAYHAWRLAKNQIRESATALTKFVETMFVGDPDAPLPPTPIIGLPSLPLPVAAGIEKRQNKFIDYLIAQPAFELNIGLDLGFYINKPDSPAPDTLQADFKVEELSGYQLRVTFRKQGQDGIRLQWRVKGDKPWTNENLTSSPFTADITPDPDGKVLTVEMQAVLIKKNMPVGLLSDLKTVAAHP